MAPLLGLLLAHTATTAANQKLHFAEMLGASGIDYRNVSGEPEKRYIQSSLGSGAALLDYDQDGDLDLYVVNGARLDGTSVVAAEPNRLYQNEGGWTFRDVTEAAGVSHPTWGMGAAVGDVDNDGYPDLYITNIGPNILYRNQGDGTFVEVTAQADVGDDGWGTSAAFFDADGDGDLDLYVANYTDPDVQSLPLPGSRPNCRWFNLDVFCGPSGLQGASDIYYRNNGDGSFTEASREAGLLAGEAYGLGVVTGDYDGDGDVDLYVANDSVPNFLFQNDGRGVFSEQGLLSGVAYNSEGLAQAGMGVDLGDLDGDGRLDIFVTNFSHDTNTAYRNAGEGLFMDATTDLDLRMDSWFYLGWATRFADLDNDGHLDLFVANGHVYPQVDATDLKTRYRQRNQIFWNNGEGRFEEGVFPAEDALQEIASSRGGAFGDMDNDGDVDAVVVNIDDELSLLRNELPGGGHWLSLRLVGRKSNRDAVGARVTAIAGSLRGEREVHASGSFLSSSDPRLHLGLGERAQVDEL
ncbi:MAG: CRTAC1 family protein, partial [Acidobacteriota bacterium]